MKLPPAFLKLPPTLNFVFFYIDDILIFSKDLEEHRKHLALVFERLGYYGLVLNKEKCIFAAGEITFLGHHVSENGVAPLESKVEAVRNFTKPSTMKGLRRFLGMVNFYRRFLPGAAKAMAPLHALLSPNKVSRKPIEWNELANESFCAIKQKLAEATMLAFPVLNAPTQLITDASDSAIGAVIQQTVEGVIRPIAFFSKNLSSAQQKWSAFDRELLAIYLAVRHFKHFLDGRSFTIFTDHKPLTFMFTSSMRNATARQTRHMNYISNYTSDIRYIQGDQNVAADCLSRPVEPCVNVIFQEQPPLNYVELAEAQESDSLLMHLQNSDNSLEISTQKLPSSSKTLLIDLSTGIARPLVPQSHRQKIFDLLHGLAHPGIKASLKLISQRFVWPGMRKDIKNWVKTCISCQRAKVQRHNVTPLQRFASADERFSHVHLDLVGPLPPSEGHSYLLTVICRITRHFEAIPLRDITAKACADNFMLHWVARFGAPNTITTDRGRQFTSTLWLELAEFLGAKLLHTTSYHPSSNGMIERVHRTLKTALRTQENPTRWYSNLGFVLLGIRASVKQDLGFSTSEITIGKPLRIPGQLLSNEDEPTHSLSEYRQHLIQYLRTLRSTEPRHPSSRQAYLDNALQSCTHVFIRKPPSKPPLAPAYDGPYQVLQKRKKYFTVDINSRVDNVSIDRLKAAHLLAPCSESDTTTLAIPANLDQRYDDPEEVSSDFIEDSDPVPLPSHRNLTPPRVPTPLQSTSYSHRDEEPADIVVTRFGRRIVRPRRFRDV